ncbi:Aste57867_320 [Aphanomyces stellatus]|uniref:Aste57867_320 protein n=1 Tax=Aphanomyces stellatus TaxID=120398 RepID=A0A485K5E9_9STRA|nr:hypothetical protein As57867_000320 [Aphanomyces stellatus]VFT77546.1 Aste57867_320 [Aphanomyces stellatus]
MPGMPPSEAHRFVHAGFVRQKTTPLGSFGLEVWVPRYFVLWGSHLFYYEADKSALRGSILLTRASIKAIESTIPPPLSGPKTSGPEVTPMWRIVVRTSYARFVFAANSQFEMYKWVDALQRMVLKEPSLSDAIASHKSHGPVTTTL